MDRTAVTTSTPVITRSARTIARGSTVGKMGGEEPLDARAVDIDEPGGDTCEVDQRGDLARGIDRGRATTKNEQPATGGAERPR